MLYATESHSGSVSEYINKKSIQIKSSNANVLHGEHIRPVSAVSFFGESINIIYDQMYATIMLNSNSRVFTVLCV